MQAAIVRALAAYIEDFTGSEHVDKLREQLGEEVRRLEAHCEPVPVRRQSLPLNAATPTGTPQSATGRA